jgi:hypothetical protein
MQINAKEYRRGNQKWTIQRHWQHRVHKTKTNKTKTLLNIVEEFLPLIYPPELEALTSSASFLDLYLEFDDSGQLSTKIYDKRDDFNFKIINFPNMCSNIPASPAYGVYIS